MSVTPQEEHIGDASSPETLQGRRAGFAWRRRLSAAASELSGRWQIPLLVLALALLGVSVWRMRPQPQPPQFDELYARALALKDAGMYEEASQYVESLLTDPDGVLESRGTGGQAAGGTAASGTATDEGTGRQAASGIAAGGTAASGTETGRLHRLMAEIIFEHESGNRVHGSTNCRRILEHSKQARREGIPDGAAVHRMRALAHEWLGHLSDAVHEYRKALAAGIENPWGVRQHILRLRRMDQDLPDEEMHEELDAFLSAPDVPLDIQFWAAECKIDLYAAQGRHGLSEQFLTDHLEQFENTDRRNEYDYLRALAWYHVGRDDDAERLLRVLLDEVVPGDPLYAESGWLLGCILQRQGAPEYALSLFNDVIDKTVPSVSRAACIVGRAECLAEVERYEESLEVYAEVIRLASEDPVGTEIDLKEIRLSTTAWYQTLRVGGRPVEAMAYLKLAARLAPPTDVPLQIIYSRRMAELALGLGKSALSAATRGEKSGAVQARTHLIEAGEEYLRLAKLAVLDAPTATAAFWEAADAFDLAGERARVISVLESFVVNYPDSPRVPDALAQLGRSYQTGGDLARAIEYYQRNLIQFPRTPAALSSLIPLADCFWETGAADKAEQTLLRVITPRPDDRLALITPEAPEYRDALFRLGDLYIRAEEYEKAIARYEEALERYAEDPRADLATFHLADSYRKSAGRVLADLEAPKHIAFKDSLQATYHRRLRRAHELFESVIDRYRKRPDSSLSELDRLCIKLSHLYSADCVYDLSLAAGGEDNEPFARSLSMYEKAAWAYQDDPIAMTAYVQIMNCYLRMGRVQQAWLALQRARWALRNIPDEKFTNHAADQDRSYWEQYLTWLERKPTFASVAVAQTG